MAQRPRQKQRYRFEHTRKGTFEGIVLGYAKTPEGDLQDTEFWTVAIDTRNGSGSEHIRRAAGAEVTTTNIRPSLVTKYEKVVQSGGNG